GKPITQVLSDELLGAVDQALESHSIIYGENYLVAYCSSKYTEGSLLYVSGIPEELDDSAKQLIELFAQNVQIAYENVQLQSELEDTQKEIVHRLSEAVEQRSSETGNHVKRVALICYLMAELYGLSEKNAEVLMHAAPLHDVGKIGIPDYILNKPGKLIGEEWETMKMHANNGFEILKESKRPIIQAGAIIARDHHERWDGTGYPAGKAGEDIHVFGRISALADVYDALRHSRCYKEAWPVDKVTDLIRSESGKHFEPRLVELFLLNITKFEKILDEYD
ncbi:MAG: putative nucleotidyltransferase with HDIG domain, partial [Phenylobacterium sp.]